MSATLKVIINELKNRCVVYETRSGEVVFDGTTITPMDLFNILEETNGLCEEVKLIKLTDEQMKNLIEYL